jgi:regulator of sirC expression with transglutaminase-like and TPR domain
MQKRTQARRVFTELIRRPDPQVPLAEAALAVAWEDQAEADPRGCLARLDAFAALARPAVAAAADGPARAAALSVALGGTLGFRGDPRCYQDPDPANSYLDRVLERRSGLPILLSLVYLEVGWRLGLPMHGVALPGHFLVRLADEAGDLFIDPFSGGERWTLGDCERQIASYYGELGAEMTAMIMAPPARGAILARILRNLKQTYMAREDALRALAAVERLMLLDATDPGELRDRGLLRLRAGRAHAAIEDLERYARENPAATDLAEIKGFLRELIGRIAPRN